MISFIRNILFLRGTENRQNELKDKFDKELDYLKENLNEEDIQQEEIVPTSCMENILDFPQKANKEHEANDNNLDVIEKDKCFEHIGIITKLCGEYGIIDKGVLFDNNVITNAGVGVNIGSKVSYMAYKNPKTDHVKVVKVTILTENNWDNDDDDKITQQKIEQEMLELQSERPKYYNTHERNILGLITERQANSLLIDVDYKILNVCLDMIDLDFVPKVGDRVYVCCKIQTDDNFLDKQGEILEETGVYPARILKNEKCKITELFQDGGAFNKQAYFTNDILPDAYIPKIGDILLADLIECERANYEMRCVKCTVLQENDKIPMVPIPSFNDHEKDHAVTITADPNCIFDCSFSKQIIDITCKNNNSNRSFNCVSIDIIRSRNSCSVRLVDSNLKNGFILKAQELRTIQFEIEPTTYGHFFEKFVLQFETFRVGRSIHITVCETAAEVEAVKQNLIKEKEAEQKLNISHTRMGGRIQSRSYAYQVWSRKHHFVPGLKVMLKRRFVPNRLPIFEVPHSLKKAYLLSNGQKDLVENIEQVYPCLKENLSFNNYVNRFQALVFMEEIEYFVNFRKYDMENAFFIQEDNYLGLTIENLTERRPSLVIGDVVRAMNLCDSNGKNTPCYEGVIHKILFDRILLKFNAHFHETYNGESYRIEFHFSRFSFRKQHAAIQRVVRSLGELFLFPTRVQKREEVQLNIRLDDNTSDLILCDTDTVCPWYNSNLNVIQKRAIFNILKGEMLNMPYVIFGPPGTGKTITLVEVILQLATLVPSSRLLVAAPSNSSADLIATRLIKSNVLKPGEFIRLVSQNQLERELIPEHLMKHCATVDIAAEGSCNDSMVVTESGLKLKCQMKYLGRHRITISTCSAIGNFMQMDFPPGHFTHVLIDECGQCTEPEAMIPINQVGKTNGCQVILVGDPRQLQAVVTNRYASARGLTTSFLERIVAYPPYTRDVLRFPDSHGYDPRIITKLVYNYRSLPSILHIYNKLFYDSELLPTIDGTNSREAEVLLKLESLLPESNKRPKCHGTFFHGMLSENMQEPDSPSWYNPCEAKNVFLMTLELYRRNIKHHNIGIITPYHKQVKHLRNLFSTANMAMPKIGSVEEFQGQERDVILISVVRSTKKYVQSDIRYALGFIQNAKRMNVAISRARCLIYIFGNPNLLVLDQYWRQLIKYCVDNDAYLGCDLPDGFFNNTNTSPETT